MTTASVDNTRDGKSLLGALFAILTRLCAKPALAFGTLVFIAFLLAAAFAPLICNHDPYTQDLLNRSVPPVFLGGDWNHWLGTDQLGRDYFARTVYGARLSIGIGLAATVISGIIGTALGLAAGYFGGRVDAAISFLITVRLCLPIILATLAVVAVLGGSLPVLVAVLGLLLWDRFVVVVRSVVQQIRSLDYLAAAELSGASTLRVLASEVLPNVAGQIIVVATLEMAQVILLEASLSFLGLGVRPPFPSWGLMIAEAKDDLLFDPWLIMVPGTMLFVLVLAINLIGDGVRDIVAGRGAE